MNKLLLSLVIIPVLFGAGCADNNNSYSSTSSTSYDDVGGTKTIDQTEAISEHWDEIKDHVDGAETVEACSSSSGNCYDLDVDISSGTIEQLHFNNGGYLNFDAEIDESGSASDTDVNGDDWDFTLDMDSSIVDDAVQTWANNNDYTIE